MYNKKMVASKMTEDDVLLDGILRLQVVTLLAVFKCCFNVWFPFFILYCACSVSIGTTSYWLYRQPIRSQSNTWLPRNSRSKLATWRRQAWVRKATVEGPAKAEWKYRVRQMERHRWRKVASNEPFARHLGCLLQLCPQPRIQSRCRLRSLTWVPKDAEGPKQRNLLQQRAGWNGARSSICKSFFQHSICMFVFFICNKYDIRIGKYTALTSLHWRRGWMPTREIKWRFSTKWQLGISGGTMWRQASSEVLSTASAMLLRTQK